MFCRALSFVVVCLLFGVVVLFVGCGFGVILLCVVFAVCCGLVFVVRSVSLFVMLLLCVGCFR